MKRLSAIVAAAALFGGTFARPATAQSKLVHQVAPGVYYRASEDQKRIIATTSWIEFRDFVVVIDANYPWGARAVLEDLRRTTAKPVRFVFDTHYHADHSYGNSVFADVGATIVSSDATAAESRAKNTPEWERNTETGEFSLKPFRLVHPQLVFASQMAIDDGERRLEFTRVGPAHTLGDSVAWLPKERILFTGDLCTTRAQNNLGDPDADLDGWVRVLDDLAKKDPAMVIPGHGIEGTVEALRGQRAFLAEIVSQVRAGMARGATADQLAAEIDLTNFKPWSDDAERNRTNIRRVYANLKKRSAAPGK
jgi:glyoxylase-like metal-dependent hydrolase (beta-lactamase superfamily II)